MGKGFFMRLPERGLEEVKIKICSFLNDFKSFKWFAIPKIYSNGKKWYHNSNYWERDQTKRNFQISCLEIHVEGHPSTKCKRLLVGRLAFCSTSIFSNRIGISY